MRRIDMTGLLTSASGLALRQKQTILTIVAVATVVIGAPAVTPASASQTFTVNSASDPGLATCTAVTCTLRAAITAANENADSDSITFAIDSGAQTIQVASPLPALVYPITIDGSTQPGFAGTPLIAISGGGIAGCSEGLNVQGGNSTVKHLAVYGFCGVQIELSAEGGDTIAGNFIGVLVDGVTVFRSDFGQGIFVNGVSANVIGGTSPGLGNVISGTRGSLIYGAGASNNSFVGNLVGTDVTGTVALGTFSGIEINGASNNVIGGTSSSARNIIAGAAVVGVSLFGPATGNVVAGNYIGTDVSGTLALPNDVGIEIRNATGNTIGGTEAGAGERNLWKHSDRHINAAGGERQLHSRQPYWHGCDWYDSAPERNGHVHL